MGIIWWFLKGVLGNLWRLLKHILQLNALAVLSPTAQCQSTELACFTKTLFSVKPVSVSVLKSMLLLVL